MTVLLVLVALLWGVPLILLAIVGLSMIVSQRSRQWMHIFLFGQRQPYQPFSMAIER